MFQIFHLQSFNEVPQKMLHSRGGAPLAHPELGAESAVVVQRLRGGFFLGVFLAAAPPAADLAPIDGADCFPLRRALTRRSLLAAEVPAPPPKRHHILTRLTPPKHM